MNPLMPHLHRSACLADGRGAKRRSERFGLLALGLATALMIPLEASAKGGADGSFERRDSFHFTLYQDVAIDEYGGFNGSRRFEQAVLQTLESAYDRLGDWLDLRPQRKLVVHVWDPGVFDQRFAGLFRFPAAGFYGGSIHIRGDVQLTPALVRVLHHELVHAAFDSVAPRLVLPAWLNEGVAEWFEARALGKRGLSGAEANRLRRAAGAGQLFWLRDLAAPSLAGFSPGAAQIAYLQSYAFITHLVDSHGQGRGARGLSRFIGELIRSGNYDRASRRAFRADLAELEESFRRSRGLRSPARR